MRFSLLLFCTITMMFAGAQTKKIAWRSHQGSANGFSVSLDNISEDDGSNFGVAPTPEVKTASLDSVIFVSDSVAVMVTSEYCERWMRSENGRVDLWRAGKDTVHNHPLFSKRHSLDSIMEVLHKQYYFRNKKKTVFMGYDNDKSCSDYSQFTILPTGNLPGGGGGNSNLTEWSVLSAIFLFMVIAAYRARHYLIHVYAGE